MHLGKVAQQRGPQSVEFGGKALHGGVWVGFRLSRVRVGLGGQRNRPGISAGSLGPKCTGKCWSHSLLFLCSPKGLPCPC